MDISDFPIMAGNATKPVTKVPAHQSTICRTALQNILSITCVPMKTNRPGHHPSMIKNHLMPPVRNALVMVIKFKKS
jgi:hypothetical protein